LNKIAKETKSQALEVDALHFSSDILSSVVVLLGLILMSFGINGADAIAALFVALFVMHAGYTMGKRTIKVLMDAAPEGTLETIEEQIKKVENVLEIKQLRVRPAGTTLFVELTIEVNRRLTTEQVHILKRNIADKIKSKISDVDLLIHTIPISVKSETIVERIHILVENHSLEAHNVYVHTNDKFYYYN